MNLEEKKKSLSETSKTDIWTYEVNLQKSLYQNGEKDVSSIQQK